MSSDRAFTVLSESLVSMTLNTKRYMKATDCETRSLTNSNNCFNNVCLLEMKRKWNYILPVFSRFTSNDSINLCNVFDDCYIDELTRVQDYRTHCLPLCDEWVFEATVTYSHMQTADESHDKITIVNIVYTSMQYTRIHNVAAFTIDMAIANVCVQAGL